MIRHFVPKHFSGDDNTVELLHILFLRCVFPQHLVLSVLSVPLLFQSDPQLRTLDGKRPKDPPSVRPSVAPMEPQQVSRLRTGPPEGHVTPGKGPFWAGGPLAPEKSDSPSAALSEKGLDQKGEM